MSGTEAGASDAGAIGTGAGEPVPVPIARRLGLLAALTAVAIYAANFVTTRYSVTNGFSSAELVALRYLVAGTLLLPRFLRAGVRDAGGLGWLRALAILCLVGAPYMFVFNLGLAFAPAAHGAVLNPGVVPSVVFVATVALGRQRFAWRKVLALALIAAGLVLVTDASFSAGGRVLAGDALLFATGLSWGAFMVCTMLWNVRPLQAATTASVLSLPFALLYLVLSGGALPEVTLAHFLGQAVMQGLVLGIAALYLTAYAVRALGSQLAALFNPLVPLMTALIAVPLLGETPSASQWTGIVVVAAGMAGGVLAGTASPPARSRRHAVRR